MGGTGYASADVAEAFRLQRLWPWVAQAMPVSNSAELLLKPWRAQLQTGTFPDRLNSGRLVGMREKQPRCFLISTGLALPWDHD